MKYTKNRHYSKADSNSEEKKDKIFYNKKKIYFTGFKKSELSDSKKREEQPKINIYDFNKNKSLKIADSRNEKFLNNKKSLKLNSYLNL